MGTITWTELMQNYKEELRLYSKSTEQGNVFGQNFLGVMRLLGQGFPKDYRVAYMWFFLSGSKGNKDTLKRMIKLEKNMTREQINIAREMESNREPIKK